MRVSAALAQREIALAAVALLAAVVGLALASQHREAGDGERRLPQAIPAPGGGWYEAVAVAQPQVTEGRTTACGGMIEPQTIGIAHPVLPCGIKLYVSRGQQAVLTQVVARGPDAPGAQFGLTHALAQRLGIRGRAVIRYRYARAS